MDARIVFLLLRVVTNLIEKVLKHVDSEVYGVPPSDLTRRQVLEKYQEYADSVLGQHGNNRPNVRDLVKPILNIFHAEPRNGVWKRHVDAAFKHCKTVKEIFEETI